MGGLPNPPLVWAPLRSSLAYNPAVRIRRAVHIALVTLIVTMTAMAQTHEFPTDRNELKGGEWFPYVFSKLAPLEWWNFVSSLDQIKRADYHSDWAYGLAKQDTRNFPRFCFSFFRASPKLLANLQPVFDKYKGDVAWLLEGDCIIPIAGNSDLRLAMLPEYVSSGNPEDIRIIAEEMAKHPPQPDAEFVKKATADLPRFCAWLEDRLDLRDKPPLLFDPHWLTREGLAAVPGRFEDFAEPGAWTAVLTRDPQSYADTRGVTSGKQIFLGFGLGMFEQEALFDELGADWEGFQARGRQGPVLPRYPLLSRLDDNTEDAFYPPEDIDSFLVECVRAQEQVKNPQSVRGLDKLIRIARWAQKLKLGIYFSGE
jgi:hypothetical protein